MRFILSFIILFSPLLKAQEPYVSAGLTVQFGEGTRPDDQIGSETFIPYIYRENFLDVTAGFGTVSVWSSFEFSSPPQIGPDHLGLRKFRLSWKGRSLSLQAGDLFGQLGQGLAINLWENQGIDWDSTLRGVWLTVPHLKGWTIDLMGGFAKGGRHLLPGPGVDPRKRDFTEDALVSAAALTRENLFRSINTGVYVVNVDAENPWFTRTRDRATGEYVAVDSTIVKTHSFIPGLFVNHPGGSHDLYLEFIGRQHRMGDSDSLFSSQHGWLSYPSEEWGWGGYGSFSFFPGRWGVTVEYKNYFFDDSDPVKRRNLPLRLGRMSPVQNPPTVFREHSSTLLSRTPHVMDFEDEVGIQVEGNIQVTPNVFLLVNFSRSSRHSGFTKRILEDFTVEWERKLIPELGWMSSGKQFYPFQEWYGELDISYDPLALDFRIGLSTITEIIDFSRSVTERPGSTEWLQAHRKIATAWETRKLFSVPVEVTFVPGSNLGVILYWEHQWENLELGNYLAFQDIRSGVIDSVSTDRQLEVPYYYRYVAMNVGRPSRFSVGVVYDYATQLKTGRIENTDPRDDSWLEALLRRAGMDLSNRWVGLQGSLYVTSSTMITVFYGSLQGGLKCDSGVCVWVPGIQDAFTATLTSNF